LDVLQERRRIASAEILSNRRFVMNGARDRHHATAIDGLRDQRPRRRAKLRTDLWS
jgi:hypothetical protein